LLRCALRLLFSQASGWVHCELESVCSHVQIDIKV
jgi:hypothetical protein